MSRWIRWLIRLYAPVAACGALINGVAMRASFAADAPLPPAPRRALASPSGRGTSRRAECASLPA